MWSPKIYFVKKFFVCATHQNTHITSIFTKMSSSKMAFDITEFDPFEIIPASNVFSNLEHRKKKYIQQMNKPFIPTVSEKNTFN